MRKTCRYQMKLATRPLLTQSVTTAVLFATGDSLAQQLVEKRGLKKHDLARTGRMALYGGGMYLPSPPSWFPITNKIYSNLRTSSYDLVQVPPNQNCPPKQEPRDRSTRRNRSNRLCIHEPLRFPIIHGYHGRLQPQG